MKIILCVIKCVTEMEKISKRMILFGYAFAFVLFLGGAISFYYFTRYIGDFSTGYYWFRELCHTAADTFGAVVIPVLIFENLYIIEGLKSRS